MVLGSAGIHFCFSMVADIHYNNTNAKQPDCSYIHRRMPPPTKSIGFMLMPGTNKHFPSFVVEVAYKDEMIDRLLVDAILVQAWLGIKINDNVSPRFHTFWAAWGARAAHGIGMVIRRTTTDANRDYVALPVELPVNGASLMG
jgi:hypothetical protein